MQVLSPRVKSFAASTETMRSAERYFFVDGLRGIAAVMVMLFHLFSLLPMPSLLTQICAIGASGVQIFFVISGFVIAHSLSSVTGRKEFGYFVVRRHLRLDPPYWAMIMAVAVVAFLEKVLAVRNSYLFPSLPSTFINLLYLQGILKAAPIVGVAWTLCIEVQFYLVFTLILALGGNSGGRPGQRAKFLIICLAAVSLLLQPASNPAVYFIGHWIFFCTGVFCYWNMRGFVSPWTVKLTIISLLCMCVLHSTCSFLWVGTITAACLYVSSLGDGIKCWLTQASFQFLGRISYSLYLAHPITIDLALKCCYLVTHTKTDLPIACYFITLPIPVLSAWIYYRLIEKPSVQLAGRFRPARASS